MNKLIAIGLSLCSACVAKCVWCPIDRGKRIKQKMLRLPNVQKIIDEIANTPELRDNLVRVKVGENGDALLNPDFLEILRYIRKMLPEKEIRLHTNFQHMTKEITDAIVGEFLINKVICNIDGADKRHYEAVKKIDFDNVMKNFTYLRKRRDEENKDIFMEIYCLPLTMYAEQLSSALGVLPLGTTQEELDSLDNDYFKVLDMLIPTCNWKDQIFLSRVFGWAERSQFANAKIDYSKHTCPFLRDDQLQTEAYIAPDGSWYICCWDANNEVVLGNVLETSVLEVLNGERRKNVIELIQARKFGKVGGPCKTVNCCDMKMSTYEFEGKHGFYHPEGILPIIPL